RLRGVLAHQPADDAAEWSVHHFDHHSLVNQWARVVLQLAADEHADALELVLGNRRRLAFERDDRDDAGALQDRQRVLGMKTREAVAGEERPVDLLLPILPAAPAGDGGEERVDALALELIADHLLVARARPDGKPLGLRTLHYWGAAACCFRPSSNAF